MKIGLQLYGPIANWKKDLGVLFEECRKIGISMLEPCILLDESSNNPSFIALEKYKELYPDIKSLGLDVISAHIVCNDLSKHIDALCELADLYGLKHFVVGMPGLLAESDKDNQNGIILKERAAVYIKVADVLAQHGANLLIHNGKSDFQIHVNGKTAYEYMIDLCQDKVGMQLDTGWAARGGADPVAFMKNNMHNIKSLHYKDFDMNIDTDDDVCIGNGTLDNEMFMLLAKEAKIPQYIDADLYNDVLKDINTSYKYLIGISE